MGKKLDNADQAVTSFEQSAGDRSKWTFEDKTEDSRLRSVAQGIYSQIQDAVATYDARSKMADRNIFKDGILPNFIDATTFQVKN